MLFLVVDVMWDWVIVSLQFNSTPAFIGLQFLRFAIKHAYEGRCRVNFQQDK